MNREVRYEVPEGTPRARCKGCNAKIYWIRTKKRKWMPVDADGTPHFAACPKARRFRKRKAPARARPLSTQASDLADLAADDRAVLLALVDQLKL